MWRKWNYFFNIFHLNNQIIIKKEREGSMKHKEYNSEKMKIREKEHDGSMKHKE